MQVTADTARRYFIRQDDGFLIAELQRFEDGELAIASFYDPAKGTMRRPRLGESAALLAKYGPLCAPSPTVRRRLIAAVIALVVLVVLAIYDPPGASLLVALCGVLLVLL